MMDSLKERVAEKNVLTKFFCARFMGEVQDTQREKNKPQEGEGLLINTNPNLPTDYYNNNNNNNNFVSNNNTIQYNTVRLYPSWKHCGKDSHGLEGGSCV